MDKEKFEERKKIICKLMESKKYIPMKEKELAIVLQSKKRERKELREVLDALLLEGKITKNKRGKYKKADQGGRRGQFIYHPGGFGFVEIEGEKEDLYIPKEEVKDAIHKDFVEVRLISGKGGKRQEATIVKVLKRGICQIVGTYERGGTGFGFVVPDNQRFSKDIFIPSERSKGAVTGHKVVVQITDYGNEEKGKKPEGKITEILGHINDPGVDILSIIKGYELPMEFSVKAMNQAERISLDIGEGDMAGRQDLRRVPMVTIDGEDAKDLDDAVSLKKEGGYYYLGVHIADVSNYVQEKSALDREAFVRGTSVYLADRVIPMLPHRLSNGICSLNPNVDRLALSCMMKINEKGEVEDHSIAETVICVDERMTYTSVKKILQDQDMEERKKYQSFVPMFQEMEELAAILRKKRKKRGSIDFDFPETKLLLDEKGRPYDIKPYDRNVATKIIEDFMLAANETIAEHFHWLELPFLYRTHESPDEEKMKKLHTFIWNFGYRMKISKDEIHPKEYQKLLEKIEGTKEEALISRLTLRSMKQARYTVENTGHFGLACPYYCHFTSPIRRYPDLQIHRIIKDYLRGRLSEGKISHYEQLLPKVAKQSSDTERRAEEAERETVKLKKVEYMEERIGQCFEGVIASITSWGIYVELPNTIEGMIHVSKIPGDYFRYEEETYEMVGEATGKKYCLGETVKIRVCGTDRNTRTIDFDLEEEKV